MEILFQKLFFIAVITVTSTFMQNALGKPLSTNTGKVPQLNIPPFQNDRITYDVTNITEDKRNSSGNIILSDMTIHLSPFLYYMANDNAYFDICWSELEIGNDSTVLEWECGYIYSITAVSVLFDKTKDFQEILQLPVSPMTNVSVVNMINEKSLLLDSLILLVKANTRSENESFCYCAYTNDNLFEYLHDNLMIIGPSKSINSSVKLGLEYNSDLVECCDSTNFDVLQYVDHTVLRLEISPKDILFSYGLFSEMLDPFLIKNRKFVRNFNPNCTLFVRLVTKRPAYMSDEIYYRHQALIAKYIQFLTEETISNEVFIISSFPEIVSAPDNNNFLQQKVSPIFQGSITSDPENFAGNVANGTCSTQELLKIVSSTFSSIAFSDRLFGTINSILSSCDLPSPVKVLNSSVYFTFYQEKNSHHIKLVNYLATNSDILNIRTIYFFHQYSSWNTPEWADTVSMLHSKDIQIGCYVLFFISSYPSALKVIEDTVARCGPLLNVSSEVLYEWHRNQNTKEELPKLLNQMNHAQDLFKDMYPGKKLVPGISVEDKKLKHYPAPLDTVADIGHVSPTLYCDQYTQRINEYYDAIISFANLHNWPKLFLRSIINDHGFNVGWWHVIESDQEVNQSITDFPVLVRTNVGITFENKTFSNTYPCVHWTQTAKETGIGFLENMHSGTTINMKLRQKPSLSAKELEMLMLFALGRFTTVELIVVDEEDVLFSFPNALAEVTNQVQERNQTVIFFEVPITAGVINKLQQIDEATSLFKSNDVAVHFVGWENYPRMEKRLHDKMNEYLHSYSTEIVGLTVQNCSHEINLRLARLKNLSFIHEVGYIVCNVKPVLAINFNLKSMQTYLDTLFYIKSYMEKHLSENNEQRIPVQIFFRINLIDEKCEWSKQAVDSFLRFLNDVNQHSIAYRIRYFVVQAFEQEGINVKCTQSWWRIENFTDLSNASVYVDREDEYFGRPTNLRLQASSPNESDVTSDSDKNNVVIIVVISVISALMLLAITALGFNLYRMRKRYLTEKELNEFYHGEEGNGCIVDSDCLDWVKLKFPESYEVPKRDIDIGRMIGSGEFGVVHFGMLPNQVEVAIKTPRPNCDKETFRSALIELKMLCYIGNHANIVSFMGANTKEITRGKIYVIMEYCENGSLQNYLRGKQTRQTGDKHFHMDLYQLYRFSQQIAAGMAYIGDKRVVHGDLSTRNVLLTSEFICKISDFGLSRRLYEMSEYIKKSKEPLPWRWMAPESLKNMEFTTKSDMWSYGVTLWEIFSLGILPYPGLSWSSDFATKLENGMRMGKTQYTSNEIHAKLLACWNIIPEERPCFEDLAKYFADLRNNEYTSLFTVVSAK